MTLTRRTLSKGLLAAAVQTSYLLSSRTALAASNLGVPASKDQAPERLEFEVATIKPINPAGGMSGVSIAEGGALKIGDASLQSLVSMAWNVAHWQIESHAEEWVTKTPWDIIAKPPELPPQQGYSTRHSWFAISDPNLRLMLQSLLVDRFQLKLHREQKSVSVYTLERDEHTPLRLVPIDNVPPGTIQADATSDQISTMPGRGFMIFAMSMPGLAKALSDYVYRKPVVDHTGLTGIYNFESKTLVTEEDFQAGDHKSFFLAAVKEMGIKTRQSQGAEEVFIIDSATPPTPN